jgi:Transglycosylase-like domain
VTRVAATLLLCSLLLILALLVIGSADSANDDPPTNTAAADAEDPLSLDYALTRERVWRGIAGHANRQAKQLRRELARQRANFRKAMRRSGTVREAVDLACVTYHVSCATLWRVALCETGGTLRARSLNRSSGASGLFQFLPSTWRTTPYARFSVWSPYTNAMAAAWMHVNGRSGEWVCR